MVATDCLIHNQFLDDSISILTAPDPQSLAEGITRALVDRTHVRTLIDNAREALQTKFSPDANKASYCELFRLVESSGEN